MTSVKKYSITSIAMFVVFIIFTILVKTVDVKPLGPENSLIGFSSINSAFIKAIGYNDFMYTLSTVLGYIAILTVPFFGLFGLMQLKMKGGFSKVDKDLYVLAGFYVMVLASYVLFEKVIINYRPIILDEGLEASYPSSHTMMAVSFMLAAAHQFNVRLKKNKKAFVIACVVIMLGIILGRLFSGVHWLTDIIGAILLSLAWFFLYAAIATSMIEKKRLNKK